MFRDKGAVRYLDRRKKAKAIVSLIESKGSIELIDRKVLDVGGGNGQISEFIGKRNCCVCVDVEYPNVKPSSNYEFCLVENETLPFRDAVFDVTISHHVIEHVLDQKRHLNELYRVLKPGGLAYLACPNKSSPFMKGHKGNKNVPTNSGIKSLLEESSFTYESQYTDYVLRSILNLPDSLVAFLQFVNFCKPIYPSHCYILKKA